jgi:hypothetical protein
MMAQERATIIAMRKLGPRDHDSRVCKAAQVTCPRGHVPASLAARPGRASARCGRERCGLNAIYFYGAGAGAHGVEPQE